MCQVSDKPYSAHQKVVCSPLKLKSKFRMIQDLLKETLQKKKQQQQQQQQQKKYEKQYKYHPTNL